MQDKIVGSNQEEDDEVLFDTEKILQKMRKCENFGLLITFLKSLPNHELCIRGVAQLALECFKDLYSIVRKHLNLPQLSEEPIVIRFDDETISLSWWEHIVYKLQTNEIEDKHTLAIGRKTKELHKAYLQGPHQDREALIALCEKFTDQKLEVENEDHEEKKMFEPQEQQQLAQIKALEEEQEKLRIQNQELQAKLLASEEQNHKQQATIQELKAKLEQSEQQKPQIAPLSPAEQEENEDLREKVEEAWKKLQVIQSKPTSSRVKEVRIIVNKEAEVTKKGNSYTGEWVDGKHEGEGAVTYSKDDAWNRVKYVGSFRKGTRHGLGQITWADGKVCKGEWREDEMKSMGVHIWPSGEKYEGAFLAGISHGLGVRKYANGDIYYGEWRKDKRHGIGVYVWTDGKLFSGKWKDDYSEGQGTMFYTNGDRYQGQFKDGNFHGVGTFTLAGKKTKSLYQNDNLVRTLEELN